MTERKSRRSSSNSSNEFDPFDTPENYYSDKNLSFNKARTFSVIDNRSFGRDFFTTPIKEALSEDSSKSATPVPDPLPDINAISSSVRRPSIMPLYDQEVNSTTGVNVIAHQMEKFSSTPSVNIRRLSLDDASLYKPRKFFISDVNQTLKELLENEDTDHNYQITIEDTGPKVLKLGTVNSNGFRQLDVRGTYMLSNLLQELTIAKRMGKKQFVLDEARLNENPVLRMKRLITTQFWKSLTRQMTKENIVEMSRDTKIAEEVINEEGKPEKVKESHRVYVPFNRRDQYEYFVSIKEANPHVKFDVQYLPEKIDAKFISSINKKPGLLALAAHRDPNDPKNLINEPYVVPGGRFNELYGWDSYMETLGLLADVSSDNHTALSHLRLARGMTENFIYEIDHYGKILNANRSYYLGRSQPPFLTDMALRVFNKTIEVAPENMDDAMDFLKRATWAAIKEYKTVWTSKPRFDEETGLSCYHPDGVGIPPETEASHFVALLKPYCEKYKLTHDEFIEKYNSHEIEEPELDEYFLHDRAVRESGHDTSYRLEGKCAYLATVDLNSLLYKYEVDIGFIIEHFYNNSLKMPDGTVETKENWDQRAHTRHVNMTKYLWNEKDSIFYDYNIKTKEQTGYESATTFWPLYSKAASQEQAAALVQNSLHKFEEFGGLVAGTLKSRGNVGISRPSRQWDYPYGWAPQQILAWIGLCNYNYDGCARRLVYRWLYLMTKAFADYNGVVVEKYNVVEGAAPHKVDAEYGNQGIDFKGVATEGFGWVNASYVFGLTFLNLHAKRNLGTLTQPEVFFQNMHPDQRAEYE